MICPFKFSFSNKEDKNLDCNQNIKAEIYSQLFDYIFYLKSTGQSVTIDLLNIKLNYIWKSIQNKVSYKLEIPIRVSIKYKLFCLLKLSDEIDLVVYYNLPRSIRVSNTDILYYLYTYISNGIYKSIVKVNNIQTGLNELHSHMQIVATLLNKDIKKVLNKNQETYLFRCDTAELYKPSINSVSPIVSIIKGIENQIYYPRNEFVTCSTCAYRKQCTWSSKVND